MLSLIGLFSNVSPGPVPTYTRAGSWIALTLRGFFYCLQRRRWPAGAGVVCSAKKLFFSFGSRSNERWADPREPPLRRRGTWITRATGGRVREPFLNIDHLLENREENWKRKAFQVDELCPTHPILQSVEHAEQSKDLSSLPIARRAVFPSCLAHPDALAGD